MHAEAPNGPGRAHGDDDARTLLGWTKELGCNFVRLAHYPHDESMTRMADRLGIMVWSEVPVYQGVDLKNTQTLAKAQQRLSDMIASDQKRAEFVLLCEKNDGT